MRLAQIGIISQQGGGEALPDWILATGEWNDAGLWDDTAVWND